MNPWLALVLTLLSVSVGAGLVLGTQWLLRDKDRR
jgi:hypothetical protein